RHPPLAKGNTATHDLEAADRPGNLAVEQVDLEADLLALGGHGTKRIAGGVPQAPEVRLKAVGLQAVDAELGNNLEGRTDLLGRFALHVTTRDRVTGRRMEHVRRDLVVVAV